MWSLRCCVDMVAHLPLIERLAQGELAIFASANVAMQLYFLSLLHRIHIYLQLTVCQYRAAPNHEFATDVEAVETVYSLIISSKNYLIQDGGERAERVNHVHIFIFGGAV